MKLLIIKETGFKCKIANPPHCISGFVDFSANPASTLFQALINHNSQELIFAAFQQTWLWFLIFFLYINLDVLNTNVIIFIFQSSVFTFTERNIHIYIQCLTHCKSGTQIFKPQKKKKKHSCSEELVHYWITELCCCSISAVSLGWFTLSLSLKLLFCAVRFCVNASVCQK